MIRRSPTRIELKLEDLTDFDYIQKFDKKKNPAATTPTTNNGVSASDAQKFIRQDRVGFRPIRTGPTTTATATGSSTASGSGSGAQVSASTATTSGNGGSGNGSTLEVMDALTGAMNVDAQTVTETGNTATETNTNTAARTPADMDISGDDRVPTNFGGGGGGGVEAFSNVDMSLDESL